MNTNPLKPQTIWLPAQGWEVTLPLEPYQTFSGSRERRVSEPVEEKVPVLVHLCMKRISNLQSNTCGFVIHLPRHLLLWDTSKPPFNIFWRCLGIGVLALGSSRLQELWSFPCSPVFYGSIDFILLRPLTFCALLRLERDPNRPHAPAGHEPSWNIKLLESRCYLLWAAVQFAISCTILCHQQSPRTVESG